MLSFQDIRDISHTNKSKKYLFKTYLSLTSEMNEDAFSPNFQLKSVFEFLGLELTKSKVALLLKTLRDLHL